MKDKKMINIIKRKTMRAMIVIKKRNMIEIIIGKNQKKDITKNIGNQREMKEKEKEVKKIQNTEIILIDTEIMIEDIKNQILDSERMINTIQDIKRMTNIIEDKKSMKNIIQDIKIMMIQELKKKKNIKKMNKKMKGNMIMIEIKTVIKVKMKILEKDLIQKVDLDLILLQKMKINKKLLWQQRPKLGPKQTRCLKHKACFKIFQL